jgi:16S rRNA (cytosine967-C5)-methyltransferase
VVAFEVLRAVSERDAYANLVLPDAISRAGLDRRDAAFTTELCYGTLRTLGTLDWVITLHCDRPLDRVDPPVLDRLRLGVYQLLYMSVPAYAAVTETVETVSSPGARGFLNAVLRRISVGKARIPWPTPEGDLVSYLAVVHAHPRWMVEMWLAELGPTRAEAVVLANNEVPGIGIRVNTQRTSTEELADRLRHAGIESEPGRFTTDTLLVRGGGAPASWPGWEEGLFAVQDEASVLVVDTLRPQAGELVVDLCAGPGGKPAHIANRGARVAATEPRGHRARMVAETLERLSDSPPMVVRADGTRPPFRAKADAVLVDAPCSGLGVLRRRPVGRWRVDPRDIDQLANTQLELLGAGYELLGEGGRLVYAVCTISSEETVEVVERFRTQERGAMPVDVLPDIPRVDADPSGALQLYPDAHGTDGMFIAAFQKT